MSGGSYNYTYLDIKNMADCLKVSTPQRRAFRELLRRVAKAAHDIEWVDSADYGPGDEDVAIAACFQVEEIKTAAKAAGAGKVIR